MENPDLLKHQILAFASVLQHALKELRKYVTHNCYNAAVQSAQSNFTWNAESPVLPVHHRCSKDE